MNAKWKALNVVTVIGTVAGLAVTVVGNAIIASNGVSSAVGTVIRSSGLIVAALTLVVFLCIRGGSRLLRKYTDSRNSRDERMTADQRMQNPIYTAPFRPRVSSGALLLVVMARIGVGIMTAITLVMMIASTWMLLTYGGSNWIVMLVYQAVAAGLILTVTFILWVASEALFKSAQNHSLLMELLRQQKETHVASATTTHDFRPKSVDSSARLHD